MWCRVQPHTWLQQGPWWGAGWLNWGGAWGAECFICDSVVKHTVSIRKRLYCKWKCEEIVLQMEMCICCFTLQDGMPVQAFVAEVLDQIVGFAVTRDEMVKSVGVP